MLVDIEQLKYKTFGMKSGKSKSLELFADFLERCCHSI
jgi:hypothetical protein